jgi:hypothetical protein
MLIAERYRIVSLLGHGGMGVVFRADDITLGQPVALKFLPESTIDRSMLERFRNEVRITRRISHPNVCRVYDISEIDNQVFLSMEYVDGEDLSSLLRRIGRLPRDNARERWWTSRLGPILDQFVATTKGNPNHRFWKAIYKPHPERIGAPSSKHSDGEKWSHVAEFPRGLSRVPVKLTLPDGAQTQLELLGGFLGASQRTEVMHWLRSRTGPWSTKIRSGFHGQSTSSDDGFAILTKRIATRKNYSMAFGGAKQNAAPSNALARCPVISRLGIYRNG